MENKFEINKQELKHIFWKGLSLSHTKEYAFKLCLQNNSNPNSLLKCKNKIINAYDRSLSYLINTIK